MLALPLPRAIRAFTTICLLSQSLMLAQIVAVAEAAAPIILPTPKPALPGKVPPSSAEPTTQAPLPNVVVSTSAAPVPSMSQRDKEILSQAVRAATKRNWSAARQAASRARDPLVPKIIEWAFLREPGPHAGFNERIAFLMANPEWPAAAEMRRRAEDVIDNSVSLTAINNWFSTNPPQTTSGRVAYARALRAQGHTQQAHDLARDAWITGSFSREEERAFLAEFDSILTPEDHWARIDYILYDGQTSAAERLLGRIRDDRALVARARIALNGSGKNVDAAIAAVPDSLKNDSGLIYDRITWRLARDDDEGARALVPPFATDGPRPELLWRKRHALARDALAAGDITEAYNLAKHHGSVDALSVSEAEWFAGWVALRFLKDGESALAHFQKVYDSVQTPPSLSRGAYWTGRTMEFLNRPDLAAEWYQRAATFLTTYYGQLALARLQTGTTPQLPQDPAPTAQERAAFNAREVTQALRALMEIDAKPYQRAFAQALADNSTTAVDRHLTAELVSGHSRVDLGVVIARQAAREKITLLQYGYPAPAYNYPAEPEKALILAISRQESNFDPTARSVAGARGLMQLMPATARGLAKRSKISYAEKRLTEPAYNMRLGSQFLASLVDSFDGSYILAAAAYNAGPSRPRQWIRQFGDPRDPNVDPIDWIEQIPFAETRSYVQRVMENVMVYRALLAGSQEIGKNLDAELVRRQ